jgi:hypothetical protein
MLQRLCCTAEDDVPLNLCTKPRRPLGIWSPASLCEQELKEEDDQPHVTHNSRLQQHTQQSGGWCSSSSWDADPHPAARPPAPTTTTSSERTFQVWSVVFSSIYHLCVFFVRRKGIYWGDSLTLFHLPEHLTDLDEISHSQPTLNDINRILLLEHLP